MSTLAQRSVAPEGYHGFKRGSRHETSHVSAVARTLEKARRHLLSIQKSDGHWCGELQGDTILESEYIMLMAFLGREHEERVRKAARYVLSQQRPEGAWSCYPGG